LPKAADTDLRSILTLSLYGSKFVFILTWSVWETAGPPLLALQRYRNPITF